MFCIYTIMLFTDANYALNELMFDCPFYAWMYVLPFDRQILFATPSLKPNSTSTHFFDHNIKKNQLYFIYTFQYNKWVAFNRVGNSFCRMNIVLNDQKVMYEK